MDASEYPGIKHVINITAALEWFGLQHERLQNYFDFVGVVESMAVCAIGAISEDQLASAIADALASRKSLLLLHHGEVYLLSRASNISSFVQAALVEATREITSSLQQSGHYNSTEGAGRAAAVERSQTMKLETTTNEVRSLDYRHHNASYKVKYEQTGKLRPILRKTSAFVNKIDEKSMHGLSATDDRHNKVLATFPPKSEVRGIHSNRLPEEYYHQHPRADSRPTTTSSKSKSRVSLSDEIDDAYATGMNRMASRPAHKVENEVEAFPYANHALSLKMTAPVRDAEVEVGVKPITRGRLCSHGRSRYRCKDCGAKGICCHGREWRRCRECGGRGICTHGRERTKCRECGGKSLCSHSRVRSQCKECGGKSVCIHLRIRSRCKDCTVSNSASSSPRPVPMKLEDASPSKTSPYAAAARPATGTALDEEGGGGGMVTKEDCLAKAVAFCMEKAAKIQRA